VSVQATVISDLSIPLVEGQNDSGWRADLSISQAARNITGIAVDPQARTVTISIAKDYIGYDWSLGEFPVASIVFTQTLPDAQTFSRIIVRDETVQNHTTLSWTAFVWNVNPTGVAKFNTDLTSWNVSPFASQAWLDQSGSTANTLLASNGIVPNNATFSPNGSPGLVIDASLASSDPAHFILKQIVIPEPGTMGLLAVVSLVWFRRRRLATVQLKA
jgi:hypothetical protein